MFSPRALKVVGKTAYRECRHINISIFRNNLELRKLPNKQLFMLLLLKTNIVAILLCLRTTTMTSLQLLFVIFMHSLRWTNPKLRMSFRIGQIVDKPGFKCILIFDCTTKSTHTKRHHPSFSFAWINKQKICKV